MVTTSNKKAVLLVYIFLFFEILSDLLTNLDDLEFLIKLFSWSEFYSDEMQKT